LISSAKCGAVLRPPVALIESTLDDAHPARPARLIMRIFLKVIRIVAGMAALVAIFCPLRTFTLTFLFLGSIAVLLICHAALMAWDDKYFAENKRRLLALETNGLKSNSRRPGGCQETQRGRQLLEFIPIRNSVITSVP